MRQLRFAGENVIATGRNATDNLSHLKDMGAAIMDLDVASPSSVILSKVNEAWSLFEGGVDVVVNNAGCIASEPLEEFK